MSRVSPVIPEPVLPTPRSRITPAVRHRIAERQKGLCAACGEPLEPGYHLDHRIPLALGGADTEADIEALHFACHAKKTAKDLGDIAKAKRIAFKAAGLKKPGAGRIKSRGFAKFIYPDVGEPT